MKISFFFFLRRLHILEPWHSNVGLDLELPGSSLKLLYFRSHPTTVESESAFKKDPWVVQMHIRI